MKNFTYNWKEIQAYHEANHTVAECMKKYGFSHTALYRARKNGHVNIWERKLPIEKLFLAQKVDSHWLKSRLIKEGIKENVCELCGQLPLWNGKKLMMQLDHIDGDHSNNLLANLRILCPNCHTQTETWGTKVRQGKLKLL